MTAIPKDLVAASASPLILSLLLEGESYGYAIIAADRIFGNHTSRPVLVLPLPRVSILGDCVPGI